MHNNYRLLLAEIIRGYTYVDKSKFGPFYIKHINNLDVAEVDYVYSSQFDKAKDMGVETLEGKTKYLIENKIWDSKEETKLKDYIETLSGYEQSKNNEFLKSKRKRWENEIEKIQDDIRKLELKKSSLTGTVAENFASKKSHEKHVLMSFFKNKDFSEYLIHDNDFNDFEQEDVDEIFKLFRFHSGKFENIVLKKIAISPFFLNMFYLSPESAYEFYGKPIVNLSFYQLELWGNAKRFRKDMEDFPNIPDDVMRDPDKIIEYVELNRNYKKAFPEDDKGDGNGGVSIVGASKEDLETLGMKAEQSFSLDEELKKKGGKLSKEDIFKLQGEL